MNPSPTLAALPSAGSHLFLQAPTSPWYLAWDPYQMKTKEKPHAGPFNSSHHL